MGIYIFQLMLILTVSFIVNNQKNLSQGKKKKKILSISIGLIWLICVLKKYTVGIDVPGYRKIYIMSADWPWFSFSNVYFEKGYTLLMQLFSKNGIDFQIFNAFVYTVIYVPWYFFLKRYSKQPTMSIIIYICYQFWVFNMSGLRQGMAMSICLIAFMLLEKKRVRNVIGFVLIVVVASFIHRSAILFLFALGIYFFSADIKTLFTFFIIFASCFVLRSNIVGFVNSFAGDYQVGMNMDLGGSFIMLAGFTIFGFAAITMTSSEKPIAGQLDIDRASIYMMLCAIAFNLAMNGSSLLRAASYFSMFVTVSFPNSLTRCTWKSKLLANLAVIVFMLGLYFSNVLLPNQLDILPYKFFWQ